MAIAKAEAERRGWPWQEPIKASGRWFRYWFMTNARHAGGNVNIRVRARDGKIIGAGFARR